MIQDLANSSSQYANTDDNKPVNAETLKQTQAQFSKSIDQENLRRCNAERESFVQSGLKDNSSNFLFFNLLILIPVWYWSVFLKFLTNVKHLKELAIID